MGSVYILTNKSYRYGWLRRRLIKIGKTEKNPIERAKELRSTGVPTPFEVAYSLQSNQYEEIEKEMHKELDMYRSNKDREFFKYPIRKAINLLQKFDKELRQQNYTHIGSNIEVVNSDPMVSNVIIEPNINLGYDYIPKLGIDGKPYYNVSSEINLVF